jgi:DNA adenine methylase
VLKTKKVEKGGKNRVRAPSPFLKWAGGKRQLLREILEAAPARMTTYYEPFVGGGAVFFALAAERRFERAVLADANHELILCYQALRDDVDGVIAELRAHRHRRNHYYAVRARNPEELAPPARAARLIYLNRCGYNGLYRVNSRGEFNVPFGRYRNPTICDGEGLRAVARALQGVELVCRDFEDTIAEAQRGDFVYLDPPYLPVSRTSNFTGYARAGFSFEDQRRLAAALRRLGQRGVAALLSNSDCADTIKLYKGQPLKLGRVVARRAINSVSTGRGPVGELLVRSFAWG